VPVSILCDCDATGKIPEAWRKGIEIAYKHESANQVLGSGYKVMFGFNHSFNRVNEKDIERAREAMEDTNKLVLELGGIPWKADLQAQKQII
jgi:hypothetical protein